MKGQVVERTFSRSISWLRRTGSGWKLVFRDDFLGGAEEEVITHLSAWRFRAYLSLKDFALQWGQILSIMMIARDWDDDISLFKPLSLSYYVEDDALWHTGSVHDDVSWRHFQVPSLHVLSGERGEFSVDGRTTEPSNNRLQWRRFILKENIY